MLLSKAPNVSRLAQIFFRPYRSESVGASKSCALSAGEEVEEAAEEEKPHLCRAWCMRSLLLAQVQLEHGDRTEIVSERH